MSSLFCSSFLSDLPLDSLPLTWLCLDPPLWLPTSVTNFPSGAFVLFPLFSFHLYFSFIHLPFGSLSHQHDPFLSGFLPGPEKVFSEESPHWCELSVGWGCGILPSEPPSHQEDMSSPKVEFVTLQNWWNVHSSHLPHGWRDTCVWRWDCPQARVYTTTTWMPNHYKRGNGPLGGTHQSFRAFCCLVALILCSCITGVWVWSSVVEVCFCHSFNKYKNNH